MVSLAKRQRPLLTGSLATAARLAVGAIARDLRKPSSGANLKEQSSQHSLGYGDAGVALFFGHLAQAGEADAARVSRRLLASSLAALEHVALDPDLFEDSAALLGSTNIWAASHGSGRT